MKGGVVIDVPGMVSGVAPTSATASTLSGCAHLRASGRQVNMAVARSRALVPRRRRMAACALESGAGGTGMYQILASSRKRDERPVPLARGDFYAGRDGLFGGLN